MTLKQQSHLKKALPHNEHVLDRNYSDLPGIPNDLPDTSCLLAYVTEV